MKSIHAWGIALIGSLLVFSLHAQVAGPDAAAGTTYTSMLGYLDNSQIGDQVMQHANGILSVNMASGDFNLQANLRAFAVGDNAQTLLQASQLQHDRLARKPLDASASIGGLAYANARGVVSINQASGNGNTELNGVAATLVSTGIREATDDTLSAAVSASAGGQPPGNPHASNSGSRSVAVDSTAMKDFIGVLQLNQIAGSGNATDNLLLLSAPSISH